MIRFKLLSVLLALAFSVSPALAEMKFAIGEPAADSTKSGIGQISGWAVSDIEIVSVEALIDGVSLGLVPYGGTRLDVAAQFPDFPDSEFSGWSMKWNYSLLEPGEHVVTIIVTDLQGGQLSKDVVFTTTSFKSQFISDRTRIKTMGAVITTPAEGLILLSGAEIDGEIVDVELLWDTASQQFQISKIIREEEPPVQNQAPKANAGPNRNVEAGTFIVVEGEASDPDGHIVSYSWSQVSGNEVELINANQAVVQFVAPTEAGNIRLRLDVMDDAGAHGQDDTLIAVEVPTPEPDPTPNKAPVANAGYNFSMDTGQTVNVTGQATDNDGTIATWSWEQVSGPAVTLSDANTSSVTFTAPDTAGTIVLRLTVTDDDGASASDDVSVTVETPPPANQSPTANAGTSRTVQQGDTVTLNGDGFDPDGTIVSWQWTRVSGTSVSISNANSQNASFIAPDTAGTIVLRLTVTDDDGESASDDVTVTVETPPPANQSPTANAGTSRTVQEGDTVTLSGDGYDPDGTIVSWQWQWVSGTSVSISNANSQNASFIAPNTAGTIVLRLTVTDDDGASGSDDVTVTVETPPPVNQSPTANAGTSRTVQQGDTVTLSGDGFDPDGTIVSWRWTRVSGTSVSISNANSQNASFTAPNTAGDIRIRLTVTDNDGDSDTDEIIITVETPPPVNQSPTANAGTSRTVQEGDTVTLSGDGYDPDGTIVSWRWTRVSGTSVSISNANSQNASFIAPDTAGTIVLRLTVTDDDGESASDDVTVTVETPPPANQSPTANAGTSRTVQEGDTVTLSGDGYDPDGTIVSWQWQWVSGTSVSISNANSQNASFIAPNTAGTIVLRLTVTDDDGASGSDDVTVTVETPPPVNQSPTANAGTSRTVQQGDTVTLSGDGFDPDGTIVSWQWQWVSGTSVSISNANSQNASFTAPNTAGTIVLRLTVTDDDGASGSDDVTVTVETPPPVNQSPTANAGTSRTVQQGDTVTLSGDGFDPDGTIVSWSWARVSGTSVSISNANSQNASFTAPNTAGTIVLRLTVTDDDGASGSDDVTVTVETPPPVNQSPTANAGTSRTVQQGDTVTLSGDGFDPDGTIVSWSWARVSGTSVSISNANSQNASFTAPNTAGTIVLRLTVTDDDGASGSDDVTVTVETPPPVNQSPTANAGTSRTVQQGDTVTLSGDGFDPDGTIVSWQWARVSGTSVSISNANSQNASFTAPNTAGTIVLRLTVTDDDGASGSDDVTVTVETPPPPDDDTTGTTLSSMLSVINAARGQARQCKPGGETFPAQPPFTWSSSLAEIAMLHSMDMARRGYFSHDTLGGSSMGTRVYSYWSGNTVGENIAASSNNLSDSAVVNMWLNSEGHCKLIMHSAFTHAGIGAGYDYTNGYNMHAFWTLDFGG